MRPHARSPVRRARGIAQGMRGAPTGQREHACARMIVADLFGTAHGMAVTPFLQQAPCVAQGKGCLLLLPPRAELGNGARQGQDMAGGARQQVDEEESGNRRQDEQVERNFGTPWRQHQQHVTLVVAGGERQTDGQRGKGQEPEQGTHAVRAYLPGPAARSRGNFRLRRAVRVSASPGRSKLTSVAARAFRVAWAACTGLARPSK